MNKLIFKNGNWVKGSFDERYPLFSAIIDTILFAGLAVVLFFIAVAFTA